MKTTRILAGTAAVLFLLLFLGALGVRVWLSGEASTATGPDHIAATAERVYLHVNGEVLVLGQDGARLARASLRQLGFGDTPIDLRVFRDGRVLIAGQRPTLLRVCGPLLGDCTSIGEEIAPKLTAQYKVAIDEERNRLLLVDFASGELWVQSIAGGAPQALRTTELLDRPNDIALSEGGQVWIADSGHHRLAALELSEQGVRVVYELSARHDIGTRGRDWPMMLAPAPSGEWWVVQPDGHARGADLLIYDVGAGASAQVALPADAYPTDIAAFGADMLVTDMDRFTVYRVDMRTRQVGEFGDAAFRDDLRRAASRKAEYRAWSNFALYGMFGLGAAMVLAAIVATPKGKRFTAPAVAKPLAASTAAPPTPGTLRWLARDARAERMLRWAQPVTVLHVLLVLGALVWVAYGFGAKLDTPEKREALNEFYTLTYVLMVFLGGMPVISHYAVRTLRAQLGSDGHRLFVRTMDGRTSSLLPEQLVYSSRMIAHKNRLYAVHFGNRRPLYMAGEIETHIAPLLARARKLSPWQMYWYLLGHREPGTVATTIYIVVVTALFIVTGLWRRAFDGLL